MRLGYHAMRGLECAALLLRRLGLGRVIDAVRDRFFARTIDQMQAFANGQGDVPFIVKRSGKATDEGIRNGRMEMSYFLGIAYQEGATVARDAAQAARWLQRAASMGSRTAQARLGAVGAGAASGSR